MMYPTKADSYDAWVDADRGQKERIRIYDLQGQVITANFILLPKKDYYFFALCLYFLL